MRRLGVTPHVSQNDKGRRSAIDGRTTRHPGYAVSLRVRKRIEEVFGWIKTVGGLRKTRHRGTALVDRAASCGECERPGDALSAVPRSSPNDTRCRPRRRAPCLIPPCAV